MRVPAIIYLLEDDPITGELDGIPDTDAQFVAIYHPRRRDGRTAAFLDGNAETILMPWHRIRHIQLLTQGELDNTIGFVRE
ncbi:MAG: hypothetical protein R3C44_19455 [Chloroflexota bacterium]